MKNNVLLFVIRALFVTSMMLLINFFTVTDAFANHNGGRDLSWDPEPIDWKLYAALDLTIELSKRFDFGMNYQHRRETNFLDREAHLFEPIIKFMFNKFFNVHGAYRFGLNRTQFPDPSFSYSPFPLRMVYRNVPEHRFMIATYLVLKKKDYPLTAQIRNRYEYYMSGAGWPNDSKFLRTRVKIKYRNIEFIEPYASAELFVRLGGQWGSDNIHRIEFGATTKLSKKSDFKTFYRIQDDRLERVPRYNVVGVEYQLKL